MIKVSLKQLKILIIEDNSVMRTNIKEMLYLAQGKDITEARNAEIGITAMEQQVFDIVLCDYNLGMGKNGQQLLEEAKYRKLLPCSSIFIMVTAQNTQEIVLGAMENKPDDYITKPFNAQQLLGRLEKLLVRKNYVMNVEKAMDAGKYNLAIQYCDQLLEQNHPAMHTQLLKTRAELAILVGDLDTAEQKYQQILQHRELSWARHGLGVVAFSKNQFERAIEAFQQVIAESPTLMESYDWLARCYEVTQQPELAQEILNTAVALSPQAILRQQKLGALADKSGNLEVAKKAYRTAVDLGKFSVHKSSNDFSSLAKIYNKTNESKHAMKILAEMRTAFQQDPEAELRCALMEAQLYTEQKNPALAAEAIGKIHKQHANIKLMPKDLRLDIVRVLYNAGSTKLAYQLISELINDNVDDDHFLNELRSIYQDGKFHDQAELLIQHTKQELIDINNKAVLLFRQGQVELALNMLSESINKMPGNRTILMNMAIILVQDMKANGVNEKKLAKVQECITKAQSLGVAPNKINQIQVEFAKLSHPQSSH